MSSWVSRIHQTDYRGVLAITGGGSLAISDLLTAPGASQSILEAHIPYSAKSLAEYLGAAPEQACSARTARALAMASFLRALTLDPASATDSEVVPPACESAEGGSRSEREAESLPWWGIGCTASLRSQFPKRGDHRFHVAVQTPDLTRTFSVTLAKGVRTRLEEERLTADFVIHAVTTACQVADHSRPDLMRDEAIEISLHEAPDGCRELLLGRVSAVRYQDKSVSSLVQRGPARSLLIFPGAFNPLHSGHLEMAALAERKLGRPVEFEISMENVDKPLLDYQEISQRLTPIEQHERPVWLTRAPTFVKKAELFPGATFLVGVDTVIRIAEDHYYGSPTDRDTALAALRRLDCRFLVFGRLIRGQFQSLDELSLPPELRSICIPVTADEFRRDISSTLLRRQEQTATDSGEVSN
jgi:hypothetical protein